MVHILQISLLQKYGLVILFYIIWSLSLYTLNLDTSHNIYLRELAVQIPTNNYVINKLSVFNNNNL